MPSDRKSGKSGGSALHHLLLHRCECGWALGENTSGDCVPCNVAIAKLPRRRMRATEATEASQPLQETSEASQQLQKTQASQPLQEDDVFEPEKPQKSLPPASRKPPPPSGKSQKKQTLSKAEKAALAAQQEAADLRSKQDAESILQGNGFARGTVVEKGVRREGLVNPDWFPITIPRDGHCLLHCFLQILKDRHPGHAVQRISDMRECLAQYFEAHDNKLEIVDVGIFSCESLECFRTGKDKSGSCNYYGGIAECVAFSYRFSISLEVHAPESMHGVFKCPGGGPTDFAPAVLLQTLGWNGNSRRAGADHWQIMISVHQVVLAPEAIAPKEHVIVTVDGNESQAKVARCLLCDVPGHNYSASETLHVVYCYILETHHGVSLGHFFPKQVRRTDAIQVSSEDDDAVDDNGDAPGVQADHDDQGSAVRPKKSSDDDQGSGCSDDDQGRGVDVDDQDGNHGGVAEQSGIVRHRAGRGRKPKNDNDADATIWCHDTELTFLKVVVARNPFAKHSGKISEKWQEIAMDMVNSTRGMGDYAVTARPDALRIKFGRMKLRLKNFRQSGKSARQSGIASVRARNEQLTAQADAMDECLNLQKDVQDERQCKKESEDAAKKCKATAVQFFFYTSLIFEAVRQGVIEPAVIKLCATNAKVQKKTLQLLAQEDRKLQHEKKFHASQGHAFVPTAVQQQNERMWAEAKQTMPAAAAEAETAPPRRERFTDIFKAQMELQEKLVKQYTEPSAVDTALMTMLASVSHVVTQPAVQNAAPISAAQQSPVPTKRQRLLELQELLNDQLISQEEFDKARTHILMD